MKLKFLGGIIETDSKPLPCFAHSNKGYKKGCADCFAANHRDVREDDLWHDFWERDSFGDR